MVRFFKSKWKFLSNLLPMKKFSMLVLGCVMLGSMNIAVARLMDSGWGHQPGDLSQLLAKYGRLTIPAPKSATDSLIFKRLFDLSLTDGHAYSRLGELCKGIGPRLSGSDNAERGIVWAVDMLKSYRFDTVFTQPVMVPRWERGDLESVRLYSSELTRRLKSGHPQPNYNCEAFVEANPSPRKFYALQACALGGSVGGKLKAQVVVINSDAELEAKGRAGLLKDKIVLLNRSFDQTLLNTFQAYGGCVSQRVNGAIPCAKYGAVGVLVRSMSNRCDLHPHTGVTHYADSVRKIPMVAVATAVADLLQTVCEQDPKHWVEIDLNCRTLSDRQSANVVASSVGAEFPEKIIAFGGHFDSWDEGEGAHDDGAGCMHAFEALRLLKAVGYVPRHTLRCVFWINEENGLRGGTEYARLAGELGENHVAALESDRGGFVPRGFGVDTSFLPKLAKYQRLLDAYGIGEIERGGGGADIGPLKKVNPNTVFVGFIPDSQRYFDVHHAETDVFENVNKRELQLGAAAVAAMIYILDQELD